MVYLPKDKGRLNIKNEVFIMEYRCSLFPTGVLWWWYSVGALGFVTLVDLQVRKLDRFCLDIVLNL
jgi:hypothetical protein